jgi:exopolysaccharide biosynthesis WecB/TagA/CpsF family protein
LETYSIYNVRLNLIDYSSLIDLIDKSISEKKGLIISYVNANTVNLAFRNNKFLNLLNHCDIAHTDGIGIYLALKMLSFKNVFRFTGSDFYEILKTYSIKNSRSCYFFGHDEDILGRIQSTNPMLKIAGTHTGYNFKTSEVIENILSNNPDIICVGLSQPIQETWVNENKDKLKNKIIICVGEGIKVFTGTKTRGPVFLRKLGLEWLIRLINSPFKYWKRYIIGNPLFLYRIIKLKIAKFGNHNILI